MTSRELAARTVDNFNLYLCQEWALSQPGTPEERVKQLTDRMAAAEIKTKAELVVRLREILLVPETQADEEFRQALEKFIPTLESTDIKVS